MNRRQPTSHPSIGTRWRPFVQIALLVVAIATALVSIPDPPVFADPPKGSPATYGLSDWGRSDLGQIIQLYRIRHVNVGPGSNVAAFDYTSGDVRTVLVAASVPSGSPNSNGIVDRYVYVNGAWEYKDTEPVPDLRGTHSEEVVAQKLYNDARALGIPMESTSPYGPLAELVTRGESEREPCGGGSGGSYCARDIPDWFPAIQDMRYNVPYGYEDSQAGNNFLTTALSYWNAAGRPLVTWDSTGRPVASGGQPLGDQFSNTLQDIRTYETDRLNDPVLVPSPEQGQPSQPGERGQPGAGGQSGEQGQRGNGGQEQPSEQEGGLENALSEDGSKPGGIDFSTLQLRYLSDSSGGLRYSFTAHPGAQQSDPLTGRLAALQQSDAFFVWLELNPDKFWVNLNPSEPDQIVDPALGGTDAGRILLQSDLLMKKTYAQLIRPDTPTGKEFWNQLTLDPGGRICIGTRMWIVPAPVTVRQDNDSLYIVDAPLDVKNVSASVHFPGQPDPESGCSDSVKAKNQALIERLILPKVRDAVNTSPGFAELRRVYLSRVAAEWYRQRSADTQTNYGNLIDENDVRQWPARTAWSSSQVYSQYLSSLKTGEWREQVNRSDGLQGFEAVGGVDFSEISFLQVDDNTFQQRWGKLPGVVSSSLSHPTVDGQGGTWLGSQTGPIPDSPLLNPWRSWGFVLSLCIALLSATAVAVVALRTRRSRSHRVGSVEAVDSWVKDGARCPVPAYSPLPPAPPGYGGRVNVLGQDRLPPAPPGWGGPWSRPGTESGPGRQR